MAPPASLDIVPDATLGVAGSRELVKDYASGEGFWPALGRGLAVAILFLAVVMILFGPEVLPAAAFGYVCSTVWLCRFERRRSLRMIARMWTAPAYRLDVDDEGLSAKSDGGSFWRRWGRATRLVERDEHVTIAFDGLETLTIPTNCFGTPEAREAWLAYARERVPATALESSIP